MLKLFHKYYPVRNLLFFLVEGGLIFLSIWIVVLVIYSGEIPRDPQKINVWARIFLINLVIQISLYYHDLYEFKHKVGMAELSLNIIQSIGMSCIFLAGLYYIFPFLILEQGIFFIGIFIVILFLVSWRLLYQLASQKQLWNEKILFVGDGELAKMIGEEIQSNLDSGYTISAVFSNPGKSGLADDLNVDRVDDYDRLCEYSLANNVSKVIVALDEKRGHSPVKSLLNCKMHGVKILDGISFYEQIAGKILVGSVPPSWLVFSDGFHRTSMKIMIKRGLDLSFSIIGIILSAPLQVIAAILVKATSPGPVFYKQTRVGQMGKKFKVIKFRTMRQDAEAQSGAVWAEEDDPRITYVGKIFRKLRIDELPQFWNVIKGDMSFVGPRPERPVFVEELRSMLPYYGERHSVKPGITGWAQVNYPYGASEEDALRKLEYDLFYIKHLSLVFDLYIVLKTVKTVIVGSGAR